MLGRIFDGLGEPMDGYPAPFSSLKLDVNGVPINPDSRTYPKDFIQTGISCIDGMNTLIRGQKLPIFSGSGLPHNRLAAQIIRQAKILTSDEPFVMVFRGHGGQVRRGAVLHRRLRRQRRPFERRHVPVPRGRPLHRTHHHPALRAHGRGVPRLHLRHARPCRDDGHDQLLRIPARGLHHPRRESLPARDIRGYLYSDLASLYERAGRIEGSRGSITQIPVLTMPSDDISHPVPDLTGYITEGQIVLDRELFQKGIYPPIAGLPSLSRLMKDGIGQGMTREDHKELSSQLFAAYSRVRSIRSLASVIGEEELSELDKRYLVLRRQVRKRFPRAGGTGESQHRADLGAGVEAPDRTAQGRAVQDPRRNTGKVLRESTRSPLSPRPGGRGSK